MSTVCSLAAPGVAAGCESSTRGPAFLMNDSPLFPPLLFEGTFCPKTAPQFLKYWHSGDARFVDTNLARNHAVGPIRVFVENQNGLLLALLFARAFCRLRRGGGARTGRRNRQKRLGEFNLCFCDHAFHI